MKTLLLKTVLFIISKWDYDSLDILYPYAQVIMYIPHFISNVLTQIFYFCLFPLVIPYVYMKEKLDPIIKLIELKFEENN